MHCHWISTVLGWVRTKRWTCTLHISTGQHTLTDQEIQSSFFFLVINGMRFWESDVSLLQNRTAYVMDQAIRSFCLFGMSGTGVRSSDVCLLAPFLSSKEGVGRFSPARLASCCDGVFSSCLQNRSIVFLLCTLSNANILSPADVGDTAAFILSRGFWSL
jgi:hypothetical protein